MESRLRRSLLTFLSIIAFFFVPITISYGQSVNYYYDDLNRLTRIDYGNGTVIDYTYDEVGNRLTENIHQLILPTTTASPAGGVYTNAQSVTLTCSDPGGPGCGNIYYTTDGSTPTTSSSIYSSPINISTTTTLKFFAKDLAGLSESVKTQVYTIQNIILPTTVASPAGGPYNTPKSVTLSCSDPGGPGCDKIYYTTDGTTPTTSSPIYSSPINISATTTLKFFAKDLGGHSEAVKSQTYTIIILPTTTASPAGGAYNIPKSVTLTCSDPGGPGCDKIYYTTDGTTPTASSPIYSSPINISATTTLKFFAKDLGGNSESVKSQTYTIDTIPPTGTITINSGGGSTNSPNVTLTFSCTDGVGCSEMQFSNDNINWSTPEAYGTTKAWTLAPWDGNETVYVKFQDAAGNWSTVYSHTIVLNNNPANPAPVRIADTNYGTLQSAYNAAADGALIKCRAITFIESLTVNRNINVTLAGGYDSGFTTNTGGQTTIKGSVTTTAGGGTITISNFVTQQ